jgi:hypothetical protein
MTYPADLVDDRSIDIESGTSALEAAHQITPGLNTYFFVYEESSLNKSNAIGNATAKLEHWLETMRGPNGYSGPVIHAHHQSLTYTGPGLDWRYEGIIAGYLQLWEKTGNMEWIQKAIRAGNDLADQQLPNGHFPASQFEMNPASGGELHEASCSVALLRLALALKRSPATLPTYLANSWPTYAICAKRNLQKHYIARWWQPQSQSFFDTKQVRAPLPQTAAEVGSALFLLSDVYNDDKWMNVYALPLLRYILTCQINLPGQLNGAIGGPSSSDKKNNGYSLQATARCVPVLLEGYQRTREEQYLAAAVKAMSFVARWSREDGVLPSSICRQGTAAFYPQWIAPLGDVLYAAHLLTPYEAVTDFSAVQKRLLDGQDCNGAIRTADGFAPSSDDAQTRLPDIRELLHVCGWCDKSFRYFTSQVKSPLPAQIETKTFVSEAKLNGELVTLCENDYAIEISNRFRRPIYRWYKGAGWADVVDLQQH